MMRAPFRAAYTLLEPVAPPSTLRGKPATRRTLLSRRDGLTAETRARASVQIAANAARLIAEYAITGTVALYAAKGSEVDTAPLDALLRARAIAIAYPRVGDGRTLSFHLASPVELASGRFGLREPRADSPAIALDAIGAFIIPGVAFDRAGGRIGWGRGHYDATLAAAPHAVRIGLAFDCQVLDQVERDPHDALLHAIVTDVATYRVA